MNACRRTGRTSWVLAVTAVLAFAVVACSSDDGAPRDPTSSASTTGPLDPRVAVQQSHGIWPQVWSQHAPGVDSFEFKVNCDSTDSVDEPCFLSDLDAVEVVTPDARTFALERDFNVNEYSGEVTRRWVLYGPPDGALPAPGEYRFRYLRDGVALLEQPVLYEPAAIDFPTNVEWEREAGSLRVTWTAPAGVAPGMHYKVILWNEAGTPDAFVSLVFPWDATMGLLPDVPFVDGGTYSLNVAVFFDDGYAYSEYVPVDW